MPPQGIVQRHDDVLERRGPREEIETLKDEAELFRPHQRPLVRRKSAHFLAVEPILARGRMVQAAEDVHQGGLAGARSAHQRHHLASADGERDAAQHRDFHFAQVVRLVDVFKSNEFHGSVSRKLHWPRRRSAALGRLRQERIARLVSVSGCLALLAIRLFVAFLSGDDLHSLLHIAAADLGHRSVGRSDRDLQRSHQARSG